MSRTSEAPDRPDDAASSDPDPGASRDWGYAIQESLVLLVPGVVFTALAIYLSQASSHLGPSRWPIWEVLLALGAIALVGGIVSIFATDEAEWVETGGRPIPSILRSERVAPLPKRAVGSSLTSSAVLGIATSAPARSLAASPAALAGRVSLALAGAGYERPEPVRRTPRRRESPREMLAELAEVDTLLRASRRRLRDAYAAEGGRRD